MMGLIDDGIDYRALHALNHSHHPQSTSRPPQKHKLLEQHPTHAQVHAQLVDESKNNGK